MSIRTRIDDARALFSQGRIEGAFVMVLVAAAATSRKRYDHRTWDDGEAFKNFVYDEMGVITGGAGPMFGVAFPFQGKVTPLEDILYHHLRCTLLHEGEMPSTVEFSAPPAGGGYLIHLNDPFGFPQGWIETLATAVWLAKENDELWLDDRSQREASRASFGKKWSAVHLGRPGQRTKASKGTLQRSEWTHDGLAVGLRYPSGTDSKKLADALAAKVAALRSGK